MRIAESESVLLALLERQGLAPELLSAWLAWRAFKEFLKEPVADAHDTAAFQLGIFPAVGGDRPVVSFVRQFSEWDSEDVETREDEPLRHVVIELEYPASLQAHMAPDEVWSQDFRSLAEFASVVEGRAGFQSAMANQPASTRVYSEEL